MNYIVSQYSCCTVVINSNRSMVMFCCRKVFLSLINGDKNLNSTVANRGSVFIGLMTPDDAIWFRYQRTVLMR